MQTKFDVGDSILLKDGDIKTIVNIHVNANEITYHSAGCSLIIKENQITPEYILELEKYLKKAQETLEIMKFKIETCPHNNKKAT